MQNPNLSINNIFDDAINNYQKGEIKEATLLFEKLLKIKINYLTMKVQ